MHSALCLSVQANQTCDKAKLFKLLLKLEHERRDMTAEAHAQRFLLSELDSRCDRPQRRAYTMLRLCEMYSLAPGLDVPKVQKLQIRNSVRGVKRLPVCTTVTTAELKHADNAAKPLPSTALCRKAVYIIRRDLSTTQNRLLLLPLQHADTLNVYILLGDKCHRDYTAAKTAIALKERHWRDTLFGPYFIEQRTAEATAKYVVNNYHFVLARLPHPELTTPAAGAFTVI